MHVRETEVPVPWGHVSVKIYGDLKNSITFLVHGVMDNAGSFDRLIPLLPPTLCYISVDLPGHGKSSHFPASQPIYTINYILAYRLICTHFKKHNYIIIGHSYGAQLGLLFAQLYPEFVQKLGMLDTLHLIPTAPEEYPQYLRGKIEGFLAQNEKEQTGPKPQYTYRDALKKLSDGRRMGYLNKAGAEALVLRSLRSVGDGRFEFTSDQRLKGYINPLHDFPYLTEVMRHVPVTCPVLILLGEESNVQRFFPKDFIDVLMGRKNICVKTVQGHHDVHNNSPEVVAPYIGRFIIEKSSKL